MGRPIHMASNPLQVRLVLVVDFGERLLVAPLALGHVPVTADRIGQPWRVCLVVQLLTRLGMAPRCLELVENLVRTRTQARCQVRHALLLPCLGLYR